MGMQISRRLGMAALAVALASVGMADIDINPTVKNWSQPLFTKEGFRKMTLHGDQMKPVTRNELNVVNLNVTVFTGDASAKVTSVVLAPTATFLVSENIAKGKDHVRLIRDDLDISGDDWVYDVEHEKVSIARNTRVVFHEQLPDILK